ncbi:MAG TPA: hypothetical protein VFI23_15080 [Rhizomicrobium sp.]|nr:hypothetical protein [Rhizomicrobium sp.]
MIRALLAAWILDLAAAALFLYRQNPGAANCLLAALAVTLAGGLWLELRHRRESMPGWGGVTTLAAVEVALLAAAVWLAVSPPRSFRIENFAVYQVDAFPDGGARFVSVAGPLPGGQMFVSPIDALVLLRIRNTGSEPAPLRDYGLEALDGNGWQALCQVRFAPNPPYYLSTRQRAREVVLEPLSLEEPGGVLLPSQERIFWSAWTCPQKCNLADTRLRLVAAGSDARGRRIEFPRPGETAGAGFPSGLDIGGVLDLDAAKETLYPRDVCAKRPRAATLW